MPRRSVDKSRRRQQVRRAHRRRNGIVATLLILAVILLGADLIRRGAGVGAANPPQPEQTAVAGAVPSASTLPSAAPSAPATPAVAAPVYALAGDYPKSGPNTWVYENTQGKILGTAGTLRRFHVVIETGVPEDPTAFAAKLDKTLGDPRSWIAGRTFRLQRVPQNANAEFAIHLATPETTRRLCASAGVDVRVEGVPYTSCRTFGKVILNLARWRESVPEYVNAKIPLEVYREYVINHEVGHQLGHNHELCPGAGKPAPVMQTQTLGMRGCVPNSWPYVNGKRYAGRLE
jgi:hypothetical protein